MKVLKQDKSVEKRMKRSTIHPMDIPEGGKGEREKEKMRET